MSTLVLVRHAQAKPFDKDSYRLSAPGEQQAIALGEFWKARNIRFDEVYCGTLRRHTHTAELAGFTSPQVTDLLREVDYGDYEGLTSTQIHEANPSWEVYSDGSPGGETPVQIYARAQQFIALSGESGGRAIAFAHGHILRAVGAAWIRSDLRVAAGLTLDVATLCVLRDDGHRLINLWNSP